MAAPALQPGRGLCENCLTFGDKIVSYPVGPNMGTVREPRFEKLSLCMDCVKCFQTHDLKELGARYRDHRPAGAVPGAERKELNP